ERGLGHAGSLHLFFDLIGSFPARIFLLVDLGGHLVVGRDRALLASLLEHDFLLNKRVEHLQACIGKLERREFRLLSLCLLLYGAVDLFHRDGLAVHLGSGLVRVHAGQTTAASAATSRGKRRKSRERERRNYSS